jgi:hypothetical protein
MVGNFPLECQQEVFAAGPDLSGAGRWHRRASHPWRRLAPDGRWQFASGVDHGDWLLPVLSPISSPTAPPGAPCHRAQGRHRGRRHLVHPRLRHRLERHRR